MKPTIGRIVHYHVDPQDDSNLEAQAAIITAVPRGGTDVDLTVFPPRTDFVTLADVPYSEQPRGGHWSWPPRQ